MRIHHYVVQLLVVEHVSASSVIGSCHSQQVQGVPLATVVIHGQEGLPNTLHNTTHVAAAIRICVCDGALFVLYV